MKILVDKMPSSPNDCPFAQTPDMPEMRRRGMLVCSLRVRADDERRVRCVCKPAFCPHLKEVTQDGRPNEDRSC